MNATYILTFLNTTPIKSQESGSPYSRFTTGGKDPRIHRTGERTYGSQGFSGLCAEL